jgi:hypothetical protein
MNTDWNPRTIFMDVREASLAAVRGTPPRPNRRGGSRLFHAIKAFVRWMSRRPSSENKKTAEWNKPAPFEV